MIFPLSLCVFTCEKKLFLWNLFKWIVDGGNGVGLDKKSRELQRSERAQDRNENYILFIFHHILPHFPISSQTSSCSFYLQGFVYCVYNFRGEIFRRQNIFIRLVGGNYDKSEEEEAGWGAELSFAVFFSLRGDFQEKGRKTNDHDDENNNKLIVL